MRCTASPSSLTSNVCQRLHTSAFARHDGALEIPHHCQFEVDAHTAAWMHLHLPHRAIHNPILCLELADIEPDRGGPFGTRRMRYRPLELVDPLGSPLM